MSANTGSVIFIAGNQPFETEIAPLMIISRLEEYDYAGATTIAVVMLVISFAILFVINLIQAWASRRTENSHNEFTYQQQRFSRKAAVARCNPRTALGALPALDHCADLLFLSCLMSPLILVFVEAFKQGVGVYFQALVHPAFTLSAVKLTLLTGGYCRAAERGVWRGGGMVRGQIQLPRQVHSDHHY